MHVELIFLSEIDDEPGTRLVRIGLPRPGTVCADGKALIITEHCGKAIAVEASRHCRPCSGCGVETGFLVSARRRHRRGG